MKRSHRPSRRSGRQVGSKEPGFQATKFGAAIAGCIWYAAIHACGRAQIEFDPIPAVAFGRGLRPADLMASVSDLFAGIRNRAPDLSFLETLDIDHATIMWALAARHGFERTDRFEALKVFLGQIRGKRDLEAIVREVPHEQRAN